MYKLNILFTCCTITEGRGAGQGDKQQQQSVFGTCADLWFFIVVCCMYFNVSLLAAQQSAPQSINKGTLDLKYYTIFSTNLLENSIYTYVTHTSVLL